MKELKPCRIELTDTTLDVVAKLSDGNPGAVRVLCECIKGAAKIDPDAAIGGLYPLLMMDTLGIYGGDIWLLYADVCHSSIVNLVAILRGYQLGLLNADEIGHAIVSGGGIDLDDVVAKVKGLLPNFSG